MHTASQNTGKYKDVTNDYRSVVICSWNWVLRPGSKSLSSSKSGY